MMREDAYNTHITGMEVMSAGADLAPILWRARLEALLGRSGARNVTSAILHRYDAVHADAKCARVTFDSSSWTGRRV